MRTNRFKQSPNSYKLAIFLLYSSLICLPIFTFSQTDCAPFHISYPGEACVDAAALGIEDGLDYQMFRTINGTLNNLAKIEEGQAGGYFLRMQNQAWYNGNGENMMERGNPRMISNLLFDQTESIPDPNGLSSLVFTFLQFIDHDITAVEGSALDAAPIPVPTGDPYFDPFYTGSQVIPFNRSEYDENTGTSPNNPRQHHNEITAWIDASMVYGADLERATWLRSGDCGKLKVSSSPHGDLLPYNTISGEFDDEFDHNAPFMAGDRNHNGDKNKVFVAGDVRANEQPGLTAMHTLFVREHNRICEELAVNGNCDDDKNYHHARKIVNGQIQSILYNELLPSMGIDLPNYSYNADKSPNILHSFATAAFRLGHTMVTEEVLVIDEYCETPENALDSYALSQAFFNPALIAEFGTSVFLRGLLAQTQEKVDAKVTNSLRNFLFGAPGSGGLDLASLNIQRGRDHGIPDFNSARVMFGISPIYSFSEITSDQATQLALETAYGNIDNIDLWVGLLTEEPNAGKIFGKTLETILEQQFRDIRDADRFYYLNDPVLNNLEKWELHKVRLEDILARNTTIKFATNVFFAKDCDSTAAGEEYCEASGENTNYEWIQSVKIGNQKISSGNNQGYADLTNEVFNLETETPNFLKMRAGYKDFPYREHWRVWIDLNRDGDFEDDDEAVFYGFKKNTVTGVIWLNEDITPGYTRMRVAMAYNEPAHDCGNFQYGEVEDYTVLIQSGDSQFRITGDDYNTDISEIGEITNFKIFPNPATVNTTIAFEAIQNGEAEITINNSFGQVLEIINIPARAGENIHELNIQNYKNGIYLVNLKLKGQRAKTVKLVIAN